MAKNYNQMDARLILLVTIFKIEKGILVMEVQSLQYV